MTAADLVTSVKLCIDESTNSSDYANSNLDSIISGNIPYALAWCASHAPLEKLITPGSSFVEIEENTFNISGSTVSYGYLNVPDGFVRLVSIRCAGWHKSVSNLISDSSDEYAMLFDSTLTATADRPFCALALSSRPVLQVFPYEATSSVELSYIKAPVSDNLTIPPTLLQSVVYYTAYLTLIAFGDDRAPSMLEASRLLIQ